MRPSRAGRTAMRLASRFLAGLAFTLAACQDGGDRVSGRGTEAENEIQGLLVDASGQAVAGALIRAYPGDPARQSPSPAVDSAVTDAQGRYALQRLTPGTYNLVGEQQEAALSVLIPGVTYSNGPAIDAGTDTLRAPGSLEGRVLQGNSGKAGVLVYAPGTSYLAVSDAAGAFRFPSLPEGTYRIRYQVSGFQVAADSNILVRTGLLTRLSDKVLAMDTALPPPAPFAARAEFDTLESRVFLSWDSVDLADRLGYRVYRDDGTLTLPVAISGLVQGTRFTDSTLSHLASEARPPEVGYRIRTLDREMNEGEEFSPVVRVRIVSPSLATTRLKLAELSPHPGMVGLGKPVAYRVDFENPSRRVRRLEWTIDGRLRRETEVDALTGSDSLTASWTSEGSHEVTVVATDEAGTAWTTTAVTRSLLDAPVARAGSDTSVSLSDTVRLRPSASDLFGKIVSWEWDIGGKGEFRPAPSGSLDFVAPATPQGRYLCILRVADEDGNHGLDTMSVRILADAPVARITAVRLEAFPGDTLVLSASASRDSLGRIVRLEWDVGATGNFASGTGEAVQVTASQPQSLPCELRVTDDDGQTDTARVLLQFVPRDRWVLWDRTPGLGGIERFQAWVHSGRLWVLGDQASGDFGRRPKLWHTRDLRQWEASSWEPPGVPHVKPVVQGGRLWMIGNEPGSLVFSDDGLAFDTLLPESFPKKLTTMVLAQHDGKLWILGTRDTAYTRHSEVWSSPDGRSWTRITGNPEYGFRVVTATASWKGRLWAYGNAWSVERAEQDLWSSADGLAWRREAAAIFPGIRQSVDMFILGDEMMMMSTHTGEATFWGERRRSGDGRTWVEVPGDAPVFSHYGTTRALVYNGRTWLLSTSENSSRRYVWEIWQAPD